MKREKYIPIIGASRDEGCLKTLDVIVQKLRELSEWKGNRLLDVGCGEGSFTLRLGRDYKEVWGIDVQPRHIDEFRKKIDGKQNYYTKIMSASCMDFPDSYFDAVLTIETLEHIPDLTVAAHEIFRVLKPGGELILTAPNRWFPCENHGMTLGNFKISRAPLLTYVPFLHRRWSNARVFTVKDIDCLFPGDRFERIKVDYAWPTFEHGGNPLQKSIRFLYPLMRKMEKAPIALRMFGTSVILKYLKK
jgi:SAM-dependent methyltransferase